MKGEITFIHVLIAIIVIAGLWYAYTTGIPEYKPEEEVTTTVPEEEVVTTYPPTEERLPIEQLHAKVKNKFTMDDVANVQVEFWEVGSDVSDPNQAPLDEVTTDSSGVGNTTDMIIQTATSYDIWFNGSSTYYDDKLSGWTINYNPATGKGYLLVDEKSWYPAVDFGSFVDVDYDNIPESESAIGEHKKNITDEAITWGAAAQTLTYDELVSGTETVRNSTGDLLVKDRDYSITYTTGSINNISVNASATATINYTYYMDDRIAYDESTGTGSTWFKLDLGNDDANSEVHEMVMCFKDADGDMEGNELTGLTAAFVSGSTKISIPGSLLSYWKDGMGTGAKRCVSIATVLGSAEKARWQFDLTIDEDNFAEQEYVNSDPEEFEMCFDDLGDYSKRQYPSSDMKVDSECLTISSKP